jgi:hypothetical protein
MDIDVTVDVASDVDNYDDVVADMAGTNMVDYVADIDDMDIDIAVDVALVAYLLIVLLVAYLLTLLLTFIF